MITTSHFSSPAPQDRKVCISRKCPRGFECRAYQDFAPLDPWAKGDWRARYRAEIAARYPTDEALRAALDEVAAMVPDGPVLCCYERDPGECHRRVLAEIVRERLGVDIPEWPPQTQHALWP